MHDRISKCKKGIWENQIPIHDRNSQQSKTEGKFLNLIENIYKKPTANNILNVKKLDAF